MPDAFGIRKNRLLTIATAATGVIVSACSATGGDRSVEQAVKVVSPHFNSVGATETHQAPHGVFSFGGMMICAARGAGTVRVVTVKLAGGNGGLQLKAFGTRPNPFLQSPPGLALGSSARSLRAEGFTPGRTTVSRCGAGQVPRTELAISVANRTRTVTGSEDQLAVVYGDSSGARGVLQLPYQLTLCAPTDVRTAACQRT